MQHSSGSGVGQLSPVLRATLGHAESKRKSPRSPDSSRPFIFSAKFSVGQRPLFPEVAPRCGDSSFQQGDLFKRFSSIQRTADGLS
ncbi:hypothetical protein Bpfe_019004 [Biomphalaria pfeifferi]|uniref:Uncharacterized protein n=1 Tax=Biomphalaria pfeifferi TaxID=112525 RepID=A0AAD8BDX8_BIOPF|nr:hypothetical protein Bpfe_019004 [Biomphalaria pfeifferi]